MNATSGRYLRLPGSGRQRSGSCGESRSDLRGSGVAARCGACCRFAAQPAIGASGGMTGYGATGLTVVAVMLLVAVAESARADRRRARRWWAIRLDLATVVGLLLLVLAVVYLAARAFA